MAIDVYFHQLAAADPILVGAGIFFVLLLCGFGLPLPEDIVLAFTGFACYLGVMPVWFGIMLGMAGVLIGDSSLWWLGHRYGKEVLNLRLFKRFLPPHRLKRIQRLYRRYGNRMLFAARFTPGLRAGVFLFAGWSGVPYRRFILTDGSAALLSVPAIVTVTYIFGAQINSTIEAVRGVEHWVLLGIIGYVVLHVLWSWYKKRKERREFNGANGNNNNDQTVENSEDNQNTPPFDQRATGTDGQ